MRLEQIAEISERLAPLAEKERGMRIEADDWNALIAAVQGILEIDRAQERGVNDTLERRFAVADHEHLGQIALEWLDPELQTQVSGGGGSVSVRSAFADLDKKVISLGDQVAKLTGLLEDQRKIVDRASVDLLDASSSLRGFDKRFGGIENLRTSVTTLNADVRGLASRLEEVLELRGSLTDPEGNPIDVAKLRDDLTAVESLRQNLEGVDGSLLRMRDIEIRIRDIEDSVGLGEGGGLDERLSGLASGVESRLTESLTGRVDGLGEELRAASAANLEEVTEDLKADIDGQTASIRASVDGQVAAIETRISGSVTAQIDAATESVRDSVLESARSTIDSRLGSLPAQIDSAVAAARVSTETALRVEFHSVIETRLREQVTAVEGRLRAEVTRIEDELAETREDLTAQVTDLFALERENLTEELHRRLDEQTTTLRSDIEALLPDRVRAEVDSALDGLDGRIDAQVDEELADLDARVETAVSAQLRTLPSVIKREVQVQIDGLSIPQSLADLESRLTKSFRTDLSKVETNLRADQAGAISEAIALLRHEISRAQRLAVEEAVGIAKAMIDQLRKELGLPTGPRSTDVSPLGTVVGTPLGPGASSPRKRPK